MEKEELTEAIIGAAMRGHRALGAGFLASVYRSSLLIEPRAGGRQASAAVRVPVYYRDQLVGDFIADILVENAGAIELKATQEIHPAHECLLVNCLQATGLDIGLVWNFGAPSLQFKRKHRIYRSKRPPVSPENPVILLKKSPTPAFTVLEMLVAMAAVGILLVILMSVLDGGSKLWRENENRVDAFREARAALAIMSRDLQNLFPTTNAGHFLLAEDAYSVLGDIAAPVTNTNSGSAVFFLSALPANAQEEAQNKSDVCQIGYFLAFDKTSSSTNKSLNLYRYFRSSDPTFAALTNIPSALYKTPPPKPGEEETELLARNVTRMIIRAYTWANGGLQSFDSAATPVPDLVEISVSSINQETAKRLDNNLGSWANTNSPVIKAAAQTFSTKVRLNRPR